MRSEVTSRPRLRYGIFAQRFATWLVCLWVMLALGCSEGRSLVGEWGGSVTSEGTKVDMVVAFGSDGTMTMRQIAKDRSQTHRGAFRLEGDVLTFTAKSVEAPGLSQEQVGQIRAALAKDPRPLKFQVRWEGSDTIVLTPQTPSAPTDTVITLKRKG